MDQLQGLIDSHCHLDVTCTKETVDQLTQCILSLASNKNTAISPHFFHLMSTNSIDLGYLDQLLDGLNGSNVIVPYFGVHPWYSHLFTLEQEDIVDKKRVHYSKVLKPEPEEDLIAVLPDPIPLEAYMDRIKLLIEKHRHNNHYEFGIGEIGLDKLFRVPKNGFYGNPNVSLDNVTGDNKMSRCRVTMEHQICIFNRFLSFAEECQRSVSIHCVKAHGILYEQVRQYNKIPTIILHSYSGSIDHAKTWINHYYTNKSRIDKPKLMFSLSNCINGANRPKVVSLLELLPQQAILIESDYPIDRYLIGTDRNRYIDDLGSISRLIAHTRSLSMEDLHLIIADNLSTALRHIC